MTNRSGGGSTRDGVFFISHAGADRAWAEWVAWQLEDAGYRVELDLWDWGAGDNFVLKMRDALERGRLLALFSAAYFEPGRWTDAEWAAVLAAREHLVPVRIDRAKPPALLRPLIAPSLADREEAEARRVLLEAVAGPSRPDQAPGYPGKGGGRLQSDGSGPRLPGSLPRVWNIPARNTDFTGRSALLVLLRQGLTDRSRVAVRALHGRGGVGKTQLAVEYTHRFAGEYELAWWINSERPALIPQQLAALAVRIGAAAADATVEEACAALAEELRVRSRWLLVFDNAEDPAALASHLPAGGGHVLITSRTPYWQTYALHVEVDTFARTDSTALLCARLPRLDEEAADRIAEALEDLPLALVQAAALLADGLTPAQYLNLLEKGIGRIADEGRPDTYPYSLAAQIRLSAQHIAETSPDAVTLLHACALLAPEPFPLHACIHEIPDASPAVATLLADPLQVGKALHVLAAQGVARVQDGTLQLHRLIQAVVRDQLTEVERTAATRTAETLLAAAYPGDPGDPATWPHWPPLVPHLLTLHPTDLTTPTAQRAACEACWYLMDRGTTATALPRLQDLHHTWKRQHGPNHRSTLQASFYLARAYRKIQDHARAHELAQDLWERDKQTLGDDHPATLQAACALAIDLAELGRIDEARALEEDTLAQQRRILGPDNRDTLHTAYILAICLADLGHTEQAHALAHDTHTRRQRILGDDHPATLRIAHILATCLADLGHTEQAHALAHDTHTRLQRILGPDHPDTLHTAQFLHHLSGNTEG